jgi:hypothetical protein
VAADHPSDFLVVSVPQLDLEGTGRKYLVEVRIGQLPEEPVYAVTQVGGGAPEPVALCAQFFE